MEKSYNKKHININLCFVILEIKHLTRQFQRKETENVNIIYQFEGKHEHKPIVMKKGQCLNRSR